MNFIETFLFTIFMIAFVIGIVGYWTSTKNLIPLGDESETQTSEKGSL